MNKNPQTSKVILYDRHEITVENGKQYCVVYDKAGETHKISEKRQALWGAFTNAFDYQAFLIIYETYNNIQYVADIKNVKDELLQRGLQYIVSKANNAQTEQKNRSTALSYAKDMLCASKIELADLYNQAEKNYRFIKGIEYTQDREME